MQKSLWNRREWLLGSGSLGAGLLAGGLPGLAGAQTSLTVGFIYVGPKDDYGYNQAHAESAAALKKMPGIKVIEERSRDAGCPKHHARHDFTRRGHLALSHVLWLF